MVVSGVWDGSSVLATKNWMGFSCFCWGCVTQFLPYAFSEVHQHIIVVQSRRVESFVDGRLLEAFPYQVCDHTLLFVLPFLGIVSQLIITSE